MSKKTEKKIIGVYPISNTMSICVHEVDNSCDRLLVSDGVGEPEWCFMDEQFTEDGEWIHGFWYGELFVPFSEVMRMNGVFETYRRVSGGNVKPKTEKAVRKWISNPYSDSAAYRLWGNGIALPSALFVMMGIVKAEVE